MLNITSTGSSLLVRGRRADKTRYTKTVKMKPYFYVGNIHGDFVSIDDVPLKKIEFDHTSALIRARDKYSTTYESDVRHHIKYMIDTHSTIDEEPIRICYLDIETEDRHGFPDVDKADKPLLSIACNDSFTGKNYIFALKENGVENITIDDVDIKLFTFKTESAMLMKFIDFVQKLDFDVFYAWYGAEFDYPYIFNRMRFFDIDPACLSPNARLDRDKRPTGRSFIDLMEAYVKLSTHKLESKGLDYVAKVELGLGKVEHEEKIGDMWENDFTKFLKYNMRDVTIMVEIDKKRGITDYFDSVRRFTFCDWYDLFNNSRVLDCYMLKCAHDMGIILPSRDFEEKIDGEVQGAIVGVLKTGRMENVASVDVKSLYPAAMKTCNMSPETVVREGYVFDNDLEYCKVDDVYFRLDKRGFIPTIIENLWDMRQEFKRRMKECEYGSDEYNKWDTIQTVCKFLLNSIYGVMKFKSFRLYCRDVFRSVTEFGRRNNLYMQKVVKDSGHELVLFDTDSNYFILNEPDYDVMVEEGKQVNDLINGGLEDWCKSNFGSAKYNCIEVEFEKIYGVMFASSRSDGQNVMKRYFGRVIYDDGKDIRDNPKLDIKGFESNRSDTPAIFRNMQKEIFGLILDDNVSEVIKILKEARKKIINGEISPDELAIPKGMSKNVYDYNRPSAHIRGAMFANQYFGEHILCEKVKYIYIDPRKCPMNMPNMDVISFTKKFPDVLIVDSERMAKRLIDKPYTNIMFTLGYGISVLVGQCTLFEF